LAIAKDVRACPKIDTRKTVATIRSAEEDGGLNKGQHDSVLIVISLVSQTSKKRRFEKYEIFCRIVTTLSFRC
jgi:hypothetical protein